MGFDATVLADSVSPAGHRLTTLQATFPRFVLAEFNTHRVFSRNSASSRAIPILKQLKNVLSNPYVPIEFGSNKPGMQAGAPLEGAEEAMPPQEWLAARDDAVRRVLGLISRPDIVQPEGELLECIDEIELSLPSPGPPADWLNVHKQVANRLLEPFMWHTVIVTATEWDNFWNLRCHPDAQPEIRRIAEMMRSARDESSPSQIGEGQWHLPLVRPEELEGQTEIAVEDLMKVSAGRCARVSYLTHAGKRDPAADVALHDQLLASGHMSPMEHPACPMDAQALASSEWSANFRGWRQYRSFIWGEADPLGQSGQPLVSVSG